MGIFKISSNSTDSQSSFYIIFRTSESCNEITINAVDILNDQYYHQLLNCDNTVIQRWAQNLHQTPEEYLSQLNIALKEQFMKKDKSNEGDKKEISLQNIFEIDKDHNLIWKQFFEVKKIFGRKGKFCLEEKSRNDILETFLCTLMNELHNKEISVSQMEKENKKLKEEHEDLRLIAESSVTMKENFEQEVYGKFANLLNTKKQKNLELRVQLLSAQEALAGTSSSKSSSVERPISKQKEVSDDDYDIDTDVDSPGEVEAAVDDLQSSSALLKRKGSANNNDSKKSKARQERSLSNEFSPDFLNDSLEAELNVGSFSSPSFRRKF